MTGKTPALILAFTSCIISSAVLAATDPPSDGRFTMSPSGDGFVRLDRQTGAMDFCSRQGSDWKCAPMAESQGSLRDELASKDKEIEALKDEKKRLEDMLGSGDTAPDAARPEGSPAIPPPPGPTLKVPDEKDVDRMFDYVEGMIKKFKERIERLEKEEKDKGEQL